VSSADEISLHDRAYYAENTEAHIYTSDSGQSMLYRLFVPKDYDPKKKYPLVFHLHGAGSRGHDNAKHLLPWFAGWIDDAVQKEHPCFILMPQCPPGQQWVNTPWKDGSYSYHKVPISQPMKLAKEVFDKVVAENPIDESRIYAVGLSMGGYGAWNFVMRYPELVSAAVPCCGAGDPSMAYKLKDIPIWVFHGDADEIVPFSGSKDMVDAIKEAGGKKIRFTIYKNFGHQAHRRAWKSKELIDWLFKQELDTH
jgi:predicted peptidase